MAMFLLLIDVDVDVDFDVDVDIVVDVDVDVDVDVEVDASVNLTPLKVGSAYSCLLKRPILGQFLAIEISAQKFSRKISNGRKIAWIARIGTKI